MALIAFEGVDAGGKATQSRLLAERLSASLFSFPAYETPMGRIIKAHLHDQWHARADGMIPLAGIDEKKLDATVLQACMLANRMELACTIARKSKAGHVVLDRYWCSGYAYGKADGLDGTYLYDIHQWLPRPTIQILIDVSYDESRRRCIERSKAQNRPIDRYERDDQVLRRVIQNYRDLWAEQLASENAGGLCGWAVVNGEQTIEKVAEDVWKIVSTYLTQPKID